MFLKSVFRTIKSSLGRYLAIFAIIALGVGFFAGLRVTEKAMLKTADSYVGQLQLYDFRLISTLGFTDDDVLAFEEIEEIESAHGSVSADMMYSDADGGDCVLHVHALLDGVNGLDIVSGRLPEAANECVFDAKYAEKNMVGSVIRLSENNSDETLNTFAYDEYTIVGLVNSVEYLNFERGTTSLGSGSVTGFAYIPIDGFSCDYYTEIYLTMPKCGEIYSDKYSDAVSKISKEVEEKLNTQAKLRYESIYTQAKSEVDTAQQEFNDKTQILYAMYGGEAALPNEIHAELEAAQMEIDNAYEKIENIKLATVYALTRNSNVGYVSFENDTAIVSGVAKVFPLFFFLVAALVCITTMTRMVSERRTENGVLKALGYGDFAVAGQYLLYAGSASIVGCILGFIVGSYFLPMALWRVYNIMYSINRTVIFVLDWNLFVTCSTVYLFCALGATWLVCYKELREIPAQLIRPKAPAAGKRILLERMGFIWHRLKFLHKVSMRNIMRYKKRLVMMILGIGGCTALLITGFGIRDSIQPIVEYQYDEIELYDASVSFHERLDTQEKEAFSKAISQVAKASVFAYNESVEVLTAKGKSCDRNINLVAFEQTPDGFIDLHKGEKQIDFPETNEAVVNYRFAHANNISLGDTLTVRDSAQGDLTVTVSGIFDNYIYDYIYISANTYERQLGSIPECTTAYVLFEENQDVHAAGAEILAVNAVASVSLSKDMEERVGSMLESLDYIVLIVLVCAGALAFIVLYNMTNITITERTREIATLKVLGFYSSEQNYYVFRENMVLTVISALCGIPMGIALLNYVMAQIKIGSMYFGVRLLPLSFVFAFVITLVFTVIVDFTLTYKTKRINMAEAMKAVE